MSSFQFPVFVTKIKNHSLIKPKILNLINDYPEDKETFNLKGQLHSSIKKTDFFKLQKTDFFKSKNEDQEGNRLSKEYFNLFLENASKDIDNLFKVKLSYTSWEVKSFWFQVYGKKDFHDYHTHCGCNFSNVYFLHLENKNETTEIKNYFDDSFYKVNAQEGDLITFPSCVIHRSPPIKNKKMVIAFDMDVWYDCNY